MKIRKQSPTENAVGRENHISFGFAYLHDVSYTDCKKVSFFIDYLQKIRGKAHDFSRGMKAPQCFF